ncbi:hypothetical protein BD408DRAFT_423795 [Parasitella parasitica]|nr:hypothetical protein BD408DRAFT_423795 [Parasitella parasitica]
MGVVLSTLSFNKKNRRGDVEDVTGPPLIIGSYRRLPNMNSEDFPSKTDQPSMSSSIIETTVLNQEHNINQQRNVTDITTKLKIPKRAWSTYHLFHLTNTLKKDTVVNSSKLIKPPRIRPKTKEISEEDDDEDEDEDDEPVEMEQLITMMQNHKVSNEVSSFKFTFDTGNDNNTSNNNNISPMPPPPPSPSSQSSGRSQWSSSPEFKFSFSANINQKNQEEELDFYQENQQQQQQNQTANINDHCYPVVNRKILPMPKPRWKKSDDNDGGLIKPRSLTNSTNSSDKIACTSVIDETVESKMDQRDNSKKLKSSPTGDGILQHPVADNKRKERNWKDHSSTSAEVTEFRSQAFYAFEKKKSTVRFGSPLKNEVPVNQVKITVSESQLPRTPSLPPPSSSLTATASNTTTTIKSSPTLTTETPNAVESTTVVKPLPKLSTKKPVPIRKEGKSSSASSSQSTYFKKANNNATAITKKKNAHRKKFNKEEMAPGGFLSSDITLFENPISTDDWICLFCQYDILMHGFEDVKKKNNFSQKKREKSTLDTSIF